MKWIVKKLISIMLIVMVVLTGFGISKTVEAASSGDTVVITNSYDENQANEGEKYWENESRIVQPGTTGVSIYYGYTDLTKFTFLKPTENYCLEDITIKLEPAAQYYPESSIYPKPISELEAGKTYRLFLEQDTTIKYTFEEANVIYAYDDTNGHPSDFDWETFRPISKKLKAGDAIVIPAVADTVTTQDGKWVFTWTSDGPENNIMPDPVTTVTVKGSWKFYELYEVEYKFAETFPSDFDPDSLPNLEKYYEGEKVKPSTQKYTSTADEDKGIWEFVGWVPYYNDVPIAIDIEDGTFVMPKGKVTVYGYWDFVENKHEYEYVGGLNQTYIKGSNKDLEGFKIIAHDYEINPDMLAGLIVEGNGEHYYPERDVDYVVTKGSIVHNLKAKFIEDNKLQPGTYTIVALFADEDFAIVNFKIENKTTPSSPKPVIPKTGIE